MSGLSLAHIECRDSQAWRTDVAWHGPQGACRPRRRFRLRRSNPGLLARRGNRRGSGNRAVIDRPVAGHCVLNHPVVVRCPYRYANRYIVTESVSYANRHGDTDSIGLRHRQAVAQPIQAVAQPVQGVAQPIQAVSEAHREATAHSVRIPERQALPYQVRLAAACRRRLW